MGNMESTPESPRISGGLNNAQWRLFYGGAASYIFGTIISPRLPRIVEFKVNYPIVELGEVCPASGTDWHRNCVDHINPLSLGCGYRFLRLSVCPYLHLKKGLLYPEHIKVISII